MKPIATRIVEADKEMSASQDTRRLATIAIANRLARCSSPYVDDDNEQEVRRRFESVLTVDKETSEKRWHLTMSTWDYRCRSVDQNTENPTGLGWDFDSPRPIIDEETSTETVDEFTELLLGGLQDRWLNSLVATKESMVEDTEQLVALSYKQ